MLEPEIPAVINLPGRKRTTPQLMPSLLRLHHSFLTWIFSSQCRCFPYPPFHTHLHCPLPPPLTKDQTFLKPFKPGCRAILPSPGLLALPPHLPCHFHCLTQSVSNGLHPFLNLHHLQPPVQHSGPAQPFPLTMTEDDMILILSAHYPPLTQVQKKSPVSGSLSMATPPVKLFSTNSSLIPLSHNC